LIEKRRFWKKEQKPDDPKLNEWVTDYSGKMKKLEKKQKNKKNDKVMTD